MEYWPSIAVGWNQQIVHILPSQKISFCGKHKCYQFLWDDGIFSKIVLRSEKGVFEYCIVSHDTCIQCELRILDFFQNPHFFQKKWLINIYYTCQKYNSLRKYHSSTTCRKLSTFWKRFISTYNLRSKLLPTREDR